MILVARLKAKPGKSELMAEKLTKMVSHVKGEEGALAYTLHQSQKDPCEFMIYEKYTDKEALEYHGQTNHFKSLQEELADIQEGDSELLFYNELVGL